MYVIRDASGRAVAEARTKAAAHRFIRRANQAESSIHNRADVPAGQVVTPLYGHRDEASSFVVADYPYGFRLRTQIRYWLETVPKKGVRFVSQTMNPKTGGWNKPKKSTFSRFGEAMYLDENGHVQSKALTEYSSADEVADFVRQFPNADMPDLRLFAAGKAKLKEGLASGKIYFTINKEPRPESEEDKIRHAAEAVKWRAVLATLSPPAGAHAAPNLAGLVWRPRQTWK